MDELVVHSSSRVPSADRAAILFVCEGNVCRSPAAELLMRQMLSLPGLQVASAGTRAMVDEGVAPDTARLLVERGLDVTGMSSRQLTARMLQEADLVVTMTAAQRRYAVLLDPQVLRRTWTLLSLAASLPAVPPAAPEEPRSLRSLGHRAAAHRSADGGDVPDPYGASRRTHARVLGIIEPAVAVVAEAVQRELWHARLLGTG